MSTLYTDTVPLHVYMDLIRPVVRGIQANLKLLLIILDPETCNSDVNLFILGGGGELNLQSAGTAIIIIILGTPIR